MNILYINGHNENQTKGILKLWELENKQYAELITCVHTKHIGDKITNVL